MVRYIRSCLIKILYFLFLGKLVKIVNGAYRGYDVVLEFIEEKKFCCSVFIYFVSIIDYNIIKLVVKYIDVE